MSNIDKRALREAAEKATPGPWGIARNGKTITSNQSHPVAVITEDFHRMLANGKTGGDAEFISAVNPATVLALLDELEAKDKSISFLKDQLAQLANFNPDWDKLEAATYSLREHMAELTAARKRIAELEAREVTLPQVLDVHPLGPQSAKMFWAFKRDIVNECADRIRAAGIRINGEG
ncbi:hypothetical protein OA46_04565 [Enterobacter cloacae]|nr:hypothetical protein OA46_04565 [Enterobacter cloacae]